MAHAYAATSKLIENASNRAPRAMRGAGAWPDMTEEQKRKTHALGENDVQLRALAECVPAFIWSADAHGVPDYYNPPFLEYLGRTLAEMNVTTSLETIHPEDRAAARGAWEHAQRTGAAYSNELRIRRASDGVYRWFTSRARPLRDDGGNVVRWFGTVIDVHDRVEAERAARVAEEKLHRTTQILNALLQASPAAIWANDLEGRFLLANPRVAANLGRTADEIVGKTIAEIASPELAETFTTNHRRVKATGRIHELEEVVELADGPHTFLSVRFPIPGDGGVPYAVAGVATDITERKCMEAALRESERRLRDALRVGRMGWLDWDLVANTIRWSPETHRLFGYSEGFTPTIETTVGMVPPEDREFVEKSLAAVIRGTADYDIDHRMVRPDGQVIHVHAQGEVMRDEHGKTLRMLGTVVDVTEQKQREEQLRQAQKLEAVGQLTAGIAHNFNNMLMGVLSNLELALGLAPAELAPLLESAADSACRATELVRKLSTYAGRNSAKVRAVEELRSLVVRAVELCRNTFDRRITFEEKYEMGAYARVDAGQVEQALMNVLINARDALESSKEAPRIAVSIALVRAGASELEGREGDHVRICVEDNGAGMDAATAQRIYEPFFTTKEVGKGTGLGLATTHAILREHGGFIRCETAKGRGATFALYIPSEPAPAGEGADSQQGPEPEPQPARGTETVLVVDDERALRRAVADILRQAGYTACEAASGDEALTLLADRDVAAKVALVLLDVSMPGLPRRELRSRLRGLTRARVIYFTGYALDAADADIDDWVVEKPVNQERLLSIIRQALDRGE